MKRIYFYTALLSIVLTNSCKQEDKQWMTYDYTAVPLVSVNTTKSSLPTIGQANTSFFKLSDPLLSSQPFEFTLTWEGFGKAEVGSIEVYLSFSKAEATPPPYPIQLFAPTNLFTSVPQFPLPSRVGTTEKKYLDVSSFPRTITMTAGEMAAFTAVDLSTVRQNDYFIFKFIVNLKDGRRIVGFQESVCDESRGEVGDCRVGARFRN